MANSQTSSGGYWYHCIIQVSDIVKHNEPVHDTRDVFYVCRVVDYKKTKKVNAYIMYIFGKIEQPIFFFKMHYFNDFQEAKTYLFSDTGNIVEI